MDALILIPGLIIVFILLLFTKPQTSRSSLEYKNWRLMVLRRDNFTCQKCGKKGGYLEAHHIKSYAAHPELRLSVNNGQTLCKPCHEQTDSYKYWKSKNN